MQKGSLLIDSSTIDPAVSQEVAALAKEKGADYMDAPVSGGMFNQCVSPDQILTLSQKNADTQNIEKTNCPYHVFSENETFRKICILGEDLNC